MPQYYRKDVLIIFLILAFSFVYFYQDGGTNGNSRFSLIFASLGQRTLAIDKYIDREETITTDHAFYNGHYYSDKAIGPTLLGIILYFPIILVQKFLHLLSLNDAKIIITFFVIGLPSAVAGSLMYLLCLYLSKSRLQSFLTTLAIFLGTMSFPFSIIFFSHQLTSSLLFGAFFMVFFLKEKREIRKKWYFFLIGLLLGWSLISEYPSLIIILALVVYYFSVIGRNRSLQNWQSIIMPILGGMIPVALQLINNKLSFNNFFSIGYNNLDDTFYSSYMSQGIAGISWPNFDVMFYTTFHPGMGIFWQSPVLILAFIGTVFAFKNRCYRDELILAACIICSYITILSGYFQWWGGWSFAPRHLVPLLPFFCLFLVFVPKRMNGVFVCLTLVSIGQMLIVAASSVVVRDNWILSITNGGFFEHSTIYSDCLNLLLNSPSLGAINLGRSYLHLSTWGSLVFFLIILVGLTLFFFRNEIRHSFRNQQL